MTKNHAINGLLFLGSFLLHFLVLGLWNFIAIEKQFVSTNTQVVIGSYLLFTTLDWLLKFRMAQWGGIALTSSILILFLSVNEPFAWEIFISVLLGNLTGSALRYKLKWSRILLTSFSICFLFLLHQRFVSSNSLTDYNNSNPEPSNLNSYSRQIKNQNDQVLEFHPDTVYLVNFTFHKCLPCKQKKKNLALIEQHFGDQKFKLITIHTNEDESYFITYFASNLNAYHAYDNTLEMALKIQGFPYEILLNKSGKIVGRKMGYNPEMDEDYLTSTINRIQRLLN